MGYTVADGVTVTETEGGTILLNEESGSYRVLNASGTIVLRALTSYQGPDALEHAIAELRSRYPHAAERIPDDVRAVVRELVGAKVVKPS